jgi:Putative Flp pilus-assembly TadE/G-like
MRPGRRARQKGQVLVIFVLATTAIMAAVGLAFDVSRFYAEKRFLQNAADAGALAAAQTIVAGGSSTAAISAAQDVLTRNFVGSPTGSNPQLPPATPMFADGHAGDPIYLVNGILITGGDIRVAVQDSVPYTFGRVVGLTSDTIIGQAHVQTTGDLLPIAVRHYINAPGPSARASSPCAGDTSIFEDLVATEDTACLGSETDPSLRSVPSPGLPFDPNNPENDTAHHGPIVALVGQGAAPSNAQSFRGFVTLDIRDFADTTSNVFYNGVTAGTQPNVLKNLEAGWVATGYPGPAFPPATSPPDPNDQVGIMDGNSAGIVVSAIGSRYAPGSEILAAVYSGTVMTIPDFSYTVPSSVAIANTQDRNGQVTMATTKNSAFNGVVTTTAFGDWGDPSNPYGSSLSSVTFAPDPNTPPATVTWQTFNTTSAPTGIYTVWIKGHSSSPYLTDHYFPVAVDIGGVVRDFSSTGSGQVFAMSQTGQTATGSVTFSTTNNNSTYFGGTVSLSIEGGAASNGTLPTGIGAVSVSPSSFTLNKNGSQAVTLSINGGSLGPGEYPLTIRATGTNSAGQKVTHLVPIVLDIATAGTTTTYVDIMGFAVFRITSVDSNSVNGYAISGVYADMNDPALSRGQVARLVPWS